MISEKKSAGKRLSSEYTQIRCQSRAYQGLSLNYVFMFEFTLM